MKLAITAFTVSAITCAALLFSHVANAQGIPPTKCAPIDKIVKMLRETHNEIPIASMRDTKNVPMQLWANLETGSWTLFFLRGDEQQTLACFLDEGSGLKVGG